MTDMFIPSVVGKKRCHGNRKLQHFKRKCRARAHEKFTFYKPSKYLRMPKKLLLQSLRLQLNCPLKKKKEQKFVLTRLKILDQQFCLSQLHHLYQTYYEQGNKSQVWLDEIMEIIGSNEPDIIQKYLYDYIALLQNAQTATSLPVELIDTKLNEFVRLHHRDLIRSVKLKENHLNANIAINRLSKQIWSFNLTANQNETIQRLIDIRMKQLNVFAKLIAFEQNIVCHKLPNCLLSDEIKNKRQYLHHELERYETQIEYYEHMFQSVLRNFESEIYKSHALIHTVKNYIYYHTQRALYYIRYKDACRLVTLKRKLVSPLNVYPQIISDMSKLPLNRLQLDYLSRTGPNYIRPNQTYLYGLKRRKQFIQDEHTNIMNSIMCYLIRICHLPNTATIIKKFSDCLQAYLQQRHMTSLSYLNIYNIRKEFKLMKAIQHRLKKGNYILRTTDKSGIFHIGHAKDYEQKAQAYRERTQAYVELASNPLSVIFHKVVGLLNQLRSKKNIQARQLDSMMPKFDTVSLGYLYFIPKPHKEGTPLRPIVSSMNTPTTGISKFLDELLRPLFDKHVRSTTIIDGVDLIRRLDIYVENDSLKPTTQFCTFDITDLYTMLPHEESLDILTEFLLQYGYKKVQGVPIDAIRKLARIVLTENVFIYEKKYYRQVIGGAMGSAFTLTLANIFMWKWEKQLVQRLHASNEIYGRYIDDIFFTSNESLDTIHQMLDEANQFHPNIKLVRQIGTSVPFLDLFIENRNGLLLTSVYHKEAAEPYTVPFKSDHPRHTFTNIIDNALLRAIRYSSTLTAFNIEQRSIKLMLLYNGYPPMYINSRFKKFLNTKLYNKCIIPLFETESAFELIRFNLLNKSTLAELQMASRISKTTDHQNENLPDIDKLIIHYTHERRFESFKKDIHHLWNEIFQSTPVSHTKLIVGHRNNKNATQELVRRRPHAMPRLLSSINK